VLSETGGTDVTLGGSNFPAEYPSLLAYCSGNAAAAAAAAVVPAVRLSSTRLLCVAPRHPPAVSVSLTVTASGNEWSSALLLEYRPAVTIISSTPLSGSANGASDEVITGTNFAADAQYDCWFGQTKALLVAI
jgi:IPT/TIG domain